MTKRMRGMGWMIGGVVLLVGLYFGWKLTSRTAYESANYSVIERDGDFELREYPELVLATTDSQTEGSSFRRLFNFISGENQSQQKIAMTTPVFMGSDSKTPMSFVLPEQLSQSDIPEPTNPNVEITKRTGGRFAVIRFSGRANSAMYQAKESRLREWIKSQGLVAKATAEVAGYDPPWTPGLFRRNEVLIRIDQ